MCWVRNSSGVLLASAECGRRHGLGVARRIASRSSGTPPTAPSNSQEVLDALAITMNHAQDNDFAANIASQIAGPDNAVANAPPIVAGKDFAFMLAARPGYMIFSSSATKTARRVTTLDSSQRNLRRSLLGSLDPCRGGRQGAHNRSFHCQVHPCARGFQRVRLAIRASSCSQVV
jgi:metal-dependent amidase/aminoacylase/carboxypeptidase family protein